MSGIYLHDTALATISINKDVFTYAQTVQGAIIECQGALEVPIGTQNVDIYMYDHQNHVISRYQGNVERPNAPNLYTPLAASVIFSTKYVFYVDDSGILRGVKSPGWTQETGIAALAIRVANYSQLTAINIAENNFQAICLYYQSPRRDAGIEMVSFSTKNNQWVKGIPDMTPIPPPPPPPPPRVIDPPLYGTYLSAVRTRLGTQVISSKMPVVYLQWDTLALAHSQEAKVETIHTLDLKFAPHTSLAIVDDGELLYCFYISSRNNNLKMITIKDSKASTPIVLATPTPRSSIAAVLPTRDRMVLFYQALNFAAGSVELRGITLVRNPITQIFSPVPNSDSSAALQSASTGKGFTVSFPSDAQYLSLSQAYNQRYTFRPAAIALPNTPQDVAAIITASAANNYQVVARSGGHSYIANGLGGKDNSVVVDLRNIKSISIDPITGNAVVGSGTKLGDIALALNNAGRAMPHGTCPYVGIGGHSGYGGYGFTSRMWGLTLDNIMSATVVISDGSIRTASSTSNSDIFWALRGAAGSFGITTSITFKTYPAPSSATTLEYIWDLSAVDAANALGSFQEYATTTNIPATFGPELIFSKGSAQGRVTFSLVGGFYGPENELDGVLAPFLNQMPPMTSGRGRKTGSYIESVAAFGNGQPLNTATEPGRRDTFYAKSLVTPQATPIGDAARRAFMDYLANNGFNANTAWFVQVELYGGSNSAINSVSTDATSYVYRSSLFTSQFYAFSPNGNPPYPTAGFGLVEGMVNALVENSPSGWDIGAHMNYVEDRLQNSQQLYFGKHYSRLRALKNIYDPKGLFTFPAGVEGDFVPPPHPPTTGNNGVNYSLLE